MEWSKARILTPRGWGLAGAGLFCVLLAQIMGRKDLLVLGLFLLLLPVLAAIGVRLLAPDFTVYREFTPAVVEAESSTTVDLAVGGPRRTAGPSGTGCPCSAWAWRTGCASPSACCPAASARR